MKRFWVGLINGLLCLIAGIALGLALLLCCDWLYRADVRLLKIPERSGLTEQAILENYHAATKYLAPWNDDALELRGLTWSRAGAEYFRRLRISVLCVYMLGLLAGIGLIALHRARKKQGRKVWNVSGVISLGLTAGLGVLLALDFERMFTGLCNALFGSSWGLYEDLDPIVTIFPQSFFVHGAFFIVFCCVAGCLLQFVMGYPTAAGRPGHTAALSGRPAQNTRSAAQTRTAAPRAAAAGRSATPPALNIRPTPPAQPVQKVVFRLRDQQSPQDQQGQRK